VLPRNPAAQAAPDLQGTLGNRWPFRVGTRP
jgi:hypothetical protein